jgi:hypothetical protein
MGSWGAATGPSAAELAAEAAVQAAVTQFNDNLTFFCPWSTDPYGAWVNGTGKVNATNSSGNSDVYVSSDGKHPGTAGHLYIAGRVWRWYQSKVLSSGNLDVIPWNSPTSSV